MKKIVIHLFVLAGLFAQDGKLAVSILDFTGEDVKDKVLNACFQQLETSLIESNRFTVIAKNQREEILKEQKFQSSGVCDEACAVEIGQLVGAEYLMLGEIIAFADLYQINIKIVNIEKGDVEEKVTDRIEGGMAQLLSGMEEASREIVRRIAAGGDAGPAVPQQPGMVVEGKKYGSVTIESNPSGATVLIEGVEKGFTPLLAENIEVGTRKLMLIKPGYETLTKGIMIKEKEMVTVSEVLIPKTGSLTVLSDPIGAIVYLGDTPRGKTPLDINYLAVMDYIVTVELENYEKVTQRVTVQYNENTTQKFDLKPMPGTVNVIADPSNAEITVYSKKYKAGASGIAKISLPIGTHKIEIKMNGYEPQIKMVTVGANESVPLEVNLKKIPAGVSSNPDIGFLTVHTYNDNVKLKISGVGDVQSLPLEYYELKYGPYALKAFKKGFEAKKVDVDIERQKTTKIEINLNKKVPEKALKYSLVFPGGGQFYAGSNTRGLLYSLTTIGLGTLIGQGIGTLQDDRDLMDQYYADYQTATSPETIDATWSIYEGQTSKVNDAQTQLMIFSGTLVASWITSMIDAYFFTGLR